MLSFLLTTAKAIVVDKERYITMSSQGSCTTDTDLLLHRKSIDILRQPQAERVAGNNVSINFPYFFYSLQHVHWLGPQPASGRRLKITNTGQLLQFWKSLQIILVHGQF